MNGKNHNNPFCEQIEKIRRDGESIAGGSSSSNNRLYNGTDRSPPRMEEYYYSDSGTDYGGGGGGEDGEYGEDGENPPKPPSFDEGQPDREDYDPKYFVDRGGGGTGTGTGSTDTMGKKGETDKPKVFTIHCMMPVDEEDYDRRTQRMHKEEEEEEDFGEPESDGGEEEHGGNCRLCAVGNQDLTEGTEPILQEIYQNHKTRAPFYPPEINSAITAKDFNTTCFESNKRLRESERNRIRNRISATGDDRTMTTTTRGKRKVPKLSKWTRSQVQEHYEEHDKSDKKKYLERDVEHCDRAQKQLRNTCLWKRDFDEERMTPVGPAMPNSTNYNLWIKLGQHKHRTLDLWHKMNQE